MKRLIVLASVTWVILLGPIAAEAYPPGGCGAPQNWPAGSADNYQRLCGESLSDAVASRSTTATKQGASGGGVAIPTAAGVSGALLGAGLVLRQRRLIQGR